MYHTGHAYSKTGLIALYVPPTIKILLIVCVMAASSVISDIGENGAWFYPNLYGVSMGHVIHTNISVLRRMSLLSSHRP